MNELTQKEGQNILIHNRYAAEHGGAAGADWGAAGILIHNRYAAEHYGDGKYDQDLLVF